MVNEGLASGIVERRSKDLRKQLPQDLEMWFCIETCVKGEESS